MNRLLLRLILLLTRDSNAGGTTPSGDKLLIGSTTDKILIGASGDTLKL